MSGEMAMARAAKPLLILLAAALALAACGGRSGGQVPSVGNSELLYSDKFEPENTGRWLLEGDDSGSTAIQGGRLVIDVSQPGAMQYTALEEPAFGDFDLAVETQLIEGNLQASYGVLFRMASPEQFYRFELTGDGHYVVERHDAGGQWQRLVDGWQKSPAIMTGTGAVNRLRIKVEGPEMAFYANDALLHQVEDSNYSGGKIALDAGTFGGQRTIAAFDNLAIGRP
jgi:hypothetical protein